MYLIWLLLDNCAFNWTFLIDLIYTLQMACWKVQWRYKRTLLFSNKIEADIPPNKRTTYEKIEVEVIPTMMIYFSEY